MDSDKYKEVYDRHNQHETAHPGDGREEGCRKAERSRKWSARNGSSTCSIQGPSPSSACSSNTGRSAFGLDWKRRPCREE